ncbi:MULTISPECIES: tyrosine-type recombinase/integrase [Hansschlegelia]|uniref:Site-specific integrase n=1 Tax=Hansschlegelia zhihuaiae TaxID=405005 RepID=A0A4Q0MDJ9_9HYPH|nr:site-specific integrase [Hansschlegelia zhihuaiae]RXF71477.1 site-specific integrase [Hansschlegelia zhihuaiae]
MPTPPVLPGRAASQTAYSFKAKRQLMSLPQTLVRRIRSVANDEAVFDAALMRGVSMPTGFVMLFDSDLVPITPANQFMRNRCVQAHKGERWKNTQAAYADDLAQWWTFLAVTEIAWNAVEKDEVAFYASTLEEAVSQITRVHYAGKTIARRVGTVLEFYRWAFRQGLTHWDPGFVPRRLLGAGSNHDPSRGELADAVSGFAKRTKDQTLIEPEHLVALRSALGPSPYQDCGEKPTRDRLMVECALQSGMRVEEVCSLTIHQVEHAFQKASGKDDWELVGIFLPVTKGNKSGTILMPVILVRALHSFMLGQRQEIVNAARNLGKFSKAEPTALFLNDLHANSRDIGSPIKTDTAMRAFTKAVRRAGLLVPRARFVLDPETGHPITDEKTGENVIETVLVPAYSFHQLRHTFAVTSYSVNKSVNPSAAIRKVQSRMRHSTRGTTEKYLRGLQSQEAEMADKYHAFMLGLADERR